MSRPTTLTGPWLVLAEKFLSVEKLAERLGVSPRTIRHWHDGDRVPHEIVRHHVEAVAKKYNITLTWHRSKKGKS